MAQQTGLYNTQQYTLLLVSPPRSRPGKSNDLPTELRFEHALLPVKGA